MSRLLIFQQIHLFTMLTCLPLTDYPHFVHEIVKMHHRMHDQSFWYSKTLMAKTEYWYFFMIQQNIFGC